MPVRAALFSYFELDDLTRLMNASPARHAPGVRVHIGSYGVNREASITVHTYRQGRYSPMFKAEIRTGPGSVDTHARRGAPGQPPVLGTHPRRAGLLGSRPPSVRLGHRARPRYRDTIRSTRDGIVVDSWQLDELGTQLAGAQGRQHREFVRGVLQGMTFGRHVLGDNEGKGFVWATRRALDSPGSPSPRAEPSGSSSSGVVPIVGEEFPRLRRRPRPSRPTQATANGRSPPAARCGVGWRPVRRRHEPGYRIGVGLGGNVNGWPRAQVNQWRNGYVASVRGSASPASASSTSSPRTAARSSCRTPSRAVARGMAAI